MHIVGEVKAKNAFADLTLAYGRARCHALPSSNKRQKKHGFPPCFYMKRYGIREEPPDFVIVSPKNLRQRV